MHSPELPAATLAAATESVDRRSSTGKPSPRSIFEGGGQSWSPGRDSAAAAWVSASRATPCPICGKPDWCRITADRQVVLCKRSDGTAPGGWRHIKAAKGGGHLLAAIGHLDDQQLPPARVRTPAMPAGRKLTSTQCQEILASSHGPGKDARLQMLAERLAVGVDVLEQLGVGWRWGDVDRGRPIDAGDWIYPMRDGSGQVVGVHRRLAVPIRRPGKPPQDKLAVQGSRLGLFYAPDAWRQGTGPIILPEGMSDTAALMHMGVAAVGRPSNRGGADDLATLLRDLPADRPVLVLGENDRKADGRWPGAEGAQATARELSEALGREVLWAVVPLPAKDAREHMRLAVESGAAPAAAGAALVTQLLEHATAVRPAPRDPILDGTVPPDAVVTMDALREQLRGRLMQLAQPPLLRHRLPDDAHPGGQPKLHPAVYLCTASTGVGKSRAALELTHKLQQLGLRVAYLSQTHRQSAERKAEAETLGVDAAAADPEINARTCGLWNAAKRVRSCGLSVQQVLCPSCPLRDSCAFQQAKAQAKEAAVRFACHAQGAQDLGKVAEGRDALIIDEDAVEALVRGVQVRPKHLLHVLRCLRTAAKLHPKLMDDDTQLLIDLCTAATERLLRAVRQSSQPGTSRIDVDGLTAPRCAEDVRWGAKVWRLLGTAGTHPPPHAMQLLLDVITGRITEVWCTHDVQATGQWDRQLVGIQRHRVPHKLVVLLDATADRATLEQVVRASGTTWCTRHQGVVQLIAPDGRPEEVHTARRMVPAGGDVLVGSSPERAAAALRGLLARVPGERLGLICHGGHIVPMFGKDANGGGLLDDAEVARFKRVAGHHTSDVRGSNSWIGGAAADRIDAVLVEGTPNVPWSEVRRRLLLTGQIDAAARPDGGWVRHQVVSTTPDGASVTNPCQAHTDPVWQEARRQLVHAALLQDLGRARHTLPEGCPVYCLTCEPLPGIVTDPAPVESIDAQTHYLVQEVVRLASDQEHPADGSESGPEGTIRARAKHHKDNRFLGRFALAKQPIFTADLMQHLARLGWCRRTAVSALQRASRHGLLVQPARGLWTLPGQAAPTPRPEAPEAAEGVTGPPAGPEHAKHPCTAAVSVTGPATLEVRPHSVPAVVISAGCPADQAGTSSGTVSASAAAISPQPTGDPVHGVVSDQADLAGRHHVRLPTGQQLRAWLAMADDDGLALWHERSAILEHDGGLPRHQAEALALAYVLLGTSQAAAPRAGPPRVTVAAAGARARPLGPAAAAWGTARAVRGMRPTGPGPAPSVRLPMPTGAA